MAGLTRVLSIDGGGIRGLVPGKVLEALEAKLKAKTGNDDAAIADYFDLIAGTSTGGILACTLLCPDPDRVGRPRFSAADAVRLYEENGGTIFHIPRLHSIVSARGLLDEKYPADGLEQVLERYFGAQRLSDLLRPALVTAYEIELRRTWFFVRPEDPTKAEEFFLRDVARATSAAPTFFEPAKIPSGSAEYAFVDGGLFANNPTLCAYAEARKFAANPTASQMAILSLGTGEHKKPFPHDEAADWGPVRWVNPVLEIMMSGVAETVHYQLDKIYDAVGKPDQYLRIQPQLPRDATEMDDASPENIGRLVKIGATAARDADDDLDKFVDLLLADSARGDSP